MPSIDFGKAVEYLDKVGDAGREIVADEIARGMDEAGLFLEAQARLNVRRQNAINFGTLWNSIAATGSGEGASRTVEIGSPLEYAAPVEFGSRHSGSGPPLGPLRLWARRRLRLSGPKATAAAVYVRNKARTRGFAPRPFMAPAFDDNQPQLQRIFGRASDRAIRRMQAL
jgi:hypothetical protein